MFDDDAMTDGPELREVRHSLDDIVMPRRPPLDAIAARGRAHRRSRYSGVAGLFVAGAAAGAALTAALAGGGTLDHGPPATRMSGGNNAPSALRTGSYTLISDTSGRVKLTINPRKLFRPAALQSDLARFGIPAKVTDGRLCRSRPEPSGLSQIVTIGTRNPQTITFDPRAIPADTELSVGRFHLKMHVQLVEAVLIRTGAYSCTTHVPTDGPAAKPGHAIGFVAIPARQATSHG
jgi:hypothetical protein